MAVGSMFFWSEYNGISMETVVSSRKAQNSLTANDHRLDKWRTNIAYCIHYIGYCPLSEVDCSWYIRRFGSRLYFRL
jgi:hypothetical protein